eukprot:EG_transcript_26992
MAPLVRRSGSRRNLRGPQPGPRKAERTPGSPRALTQLQLVRRPTAEEAAREEGEEDTSRHLPKGPRRTSGRPSSASPAQPPPTPTPQSPASRRSRPPRVDPGPGLGPDRPPLPASPSALSPRTRRSAERPSPHALLPLSSRGAPAAPGSRSAGFATATPATAEYAAGASSPRRAPAVPERPAVVCGVPLAVPNDSPRRETAPLAAPMPSSTGALGAIAPVSLPVAHPTPGSALAPPPPAPEAGP